MRAITNYQILTAEDPETLARLVKARLPHGWQPFGSLSVTAGDGTTIDGTWSSYSQPMVVYGQKMDD